jgi:glucose-6-phosphate isomerase
VGLYASLANVNAYHQPAVESGKKAAAAVLALQARIEAALAEPITPAALAARLGADRVDVFYVLRHLAHNGRARAEPTDAAPWHWRYGR